MTVEERIAALEARLNGAKGTLQTTALAVSEVSADLADLKDNPPEGLDPDMVNAMLVSTEAAMHGLVARIEGTSHEVESAKAMIAFFKSKQP